MYVQHCFIERVEPLGGRLKCQRMGAYFRRWSWYRVVSAGG